MGHTRHPEGLIVVDLEVFWFCYQPESLPSRCTRSLCFMVQHLGFLHACCVYGGSEYRPQEITIRKGVDIIVGTTGRVKDFILKGTLNFKSLKFRVLDEADEMLNMGFVDDVDLILGKVEDASKVQTLLFSATMSDWLEGVWSPLTRYITIFELLICSGGSATYIIGSLVAWRNLVFVGIVPCVLLLAGLLFIPVAKMFG